jgi:predicted HD superfamily hydrolase involved in NAD metabolism
MISVCSNDERVKTYPFWKTLHGIAASYYVKEKFNIADNKVLNAIANHVIPVQDVDEVSMALYLADKLEDTRDSYRIDNIEYYKKLSLTNLKQAYIETRNAYLDFEDKKKTN